MKVLLIEHTKKKYKYVLPLCPHQACKEQTNQGNFLLKSPLGSSVSYLVTDLGPTKKKFSEFFKKAKELEVSHLFFCREGLFEKRSSIIKFCGLLSAFHQNEKNSTRFESMLKIPIKHIDKDTAELLKEANVKNIIIDISYPNPKERVLSYHLDIFYDFTKATETLKYLKIKVIGNIILSGGKTNSKKNKALLEFTMNSELDFANFTYKKEHERAIGNYWDKFEESRIPSLNKKNNFFNHL